MMIEGNGWRVWEHPIASRKMRPYGRVNVQTDGKLVVADAHELARAIRSVAQAIFEHEYGEEVE